MQCKYTKPDGQRCQANAVVNNEYCFSHHPELKEEKALAVKKGGLNRRLVQDYGEEIKIETPEDIRNLLAETINMIRTGKMPCSQPANSIGFLARCWLDADDAAMTKAKMEEILDKLEEAKL